MRDSGVRPSTFSPAARAALRTFSPLFSPTHFHEDPQVLTDRTLSQWELLDAFESRHVCELRRDSLRRIEESSYSKAAASYLQMMREQTETPAVSLQRYMVENYHANIRTYAASRCVSRDDPGLPRGLRAK